MCMPQAQALGRLDKAGKVFFPKTLQFWTEEPQGWFRVFELH